MQATELTVIFWNVWFYTQDGKRDSGKLLITRLSKLIEDFDPDVLGLNEVLVNDNNDSKVITYLTNLGYSCYFALISPTSKDWRVGNLLATKTKPIKTREHILGPDTQAERRGYKGYNVKAIEADVKVGSARVTILLTYLSSLLPLDWKTHITHRKNYENIVKSIKNRNLIIGGDFNETKYMLPWLRLPKYLKRETGSMFNPTWRLNGQKRFIVFANYDNVIYSRQGQLYLKSFQVLGRWPSDHSPLLSVFKFK